MAQLFDFSTNYEYESFIDVMETLMNFNVESMLKVAFKVYDYDSDF